MVVIGFSYSTVACRMDKGASMTGFIYISVGVPSGLGICALFLAFSLWAFFCVDIDITILRLPIGPLQLQAWFAGGQLI